MSAPSSSSLLSSSVPPSSPSPSLSVPSPSPSSSSSSAASASKGPASEGAGGATDPLPPASSTRTTRRARRWRGKPRKSNSSQVKEGDSKSGPQVSPSSMPPRDDVARSLARINAKLDEQLVALRWLGHQVLKMRNVMRYARWEIGTNRAHIRAIRKSMHEKWGTRHPDHPPWEAEFVGRTPDCSNPDEEEN